MVGAMVFAEQDGPPKVCMTHALHGTFWSICTVRYTGICMRNVSYQRSEFVVRRQLFKIPALLLSLYWTVCHISPIHSQRPGIVLAECSFAWRLEHNRAFPARCRSPSVSRFLEGVSSEVITATPKTFTVSTRL